MVVVVVHTDGRWITKKADRFIYFFNSELIAAHRGGKKRDARYDMKRESEGSISLSHHFLSSITALTDLTNNRALHVDKIHVIDVFPAIRAAYY